MDLDLGARDVRPPVDRRQQGEKAQLGHVGDDHNVQEPVIQTGAAQGMQSMDSALATLVRAGSITHELALSRSSAPDELRRLLGGVALVA